MKIEIIDREKYLAIVNDRIKSIRDTQKRQDAEYEKQWRKRWFFKDLPDTEFPPQDNWPFYPSGAGGFLLDRLESMKSALESEGTGYVTFGTKEWEAIS